MAVPKTQRIVKKVKKPVPPNPAKVTSERKKYVGDLLNEKASRERANYRQQQNTDNKEMCFDCEWYKQPGEMESACAKVAGPVAARDVCDFWTSRH